MKPEGSNPWLFAHNSGHNQGDFLQFCHSQGAIHVRNALILYDPELRKRIRVVAVAPGAYIWPELCGRVRHFVSPYDIVPKLDPVGRLRAGDTVITLQRHTAISRWDPDHSFLSPTYVQPLQAEIDDFKASQMRYL